eukprot:3595923-Amphidinium_carterae.1
MQPKVSGFALQCRIPRVGYRGSSGMWNSSDLITSELTKRKSGNAALAGASAADALCAHGLT